MKGINYSGAGTRHTIPKRIWLWVLVCTMGILQVRAEKAGATLQPARETKQPSESRKNFTLPPLPAGVTELKFRDFFKLPVGPRGLELTAKVKELDGKRVRILGFMAQQEAPTPGVFLLAPQPSHQNEDTCLVDDLPPCTLRVLVPGRSAEIIPYTRQPLLLSGILSIGNRVEPNGHVSLMRLTLDPIKEFKLQPKVRFTAERGSAQLMR